LSQRKFTLAPGATGFASELRSARCGLVAMFRRCEGVLALDGFKPARGRRWLYLVVFGTLICVNAYMVLAGAHLRQLGRQLFACKSGRALLLGVDPGVWESVSRGVVVGGYCAGRCGDIVRGAARINRTVVEERSMAKRIELTKYPVVTGSGYPAPLMWRAPLERGNVWAMRRVLRILE